MNDVAEVVDTDGVAVGDEPTEPIRASDVSVEELPTYSIAGVVQWMKDPRNDAVIKEFGKQLHEAPKRFAQRVEAEFAPAGQLMINMAKDKDVAQSVLDDFLRSITGIED